MSRRSFQRCAVLGPLALISLFSAHGETRLKAAEPDATVRFNSNLPLAIWVLPGDDVHRYVNWVSEKPGRIPKNAPCYFGFGWGWEGMGADRRLGLESYHYLVEHCAHGHGFDWRFDDYSWMLWDETFPKLDVPKSLLSFSRPFHSCSQVIAKTPAEKPIELPTGLLWGVRTSGEPNLRVNDVLREIAAKNVPGLMISGGDPASYLANPSDLRYLKYLGVESDALSEADLASLKNLTDLQTLSLTSKSVSGQGLANLRQLKKLRRLVLNCPSISDEALAHIRELTGLQVLDLSGAHVTDQGLQHLKDMKRLQAIKLEQTDVTGSGLAHLKDISSLRELVLSGEQVTDAGLAGLEDLTELQILTIGSNRKMTGKGFAHLKRLQNLRVLHLDTLRLASSGLVHLPPLHSLQGLYLRIRNPKVNLASLGKLRGLRTLDLSNLGTTVTDTNLECLEGLTKLEALNLGGNYRITAAGLAHLQGLTELRILNLAYTGVADNGLFFLKDLHKLQSLNLQSSPWNGNIHHKGTLSGAGLAYLTELKDLQNLNLSHTMLLDPALLYLQRMKGLRHLNLDNTQVTDKGLLMLTAPTMLAAPANLRRIRNPSLAYPDPRLEQPREATDLQSLTLWNTNVTDAGAVCLKNLKGLRFLYLDSRRVSAGCAKDLKTSLPNLYIWPDGPASLEY
jgi:internalin A